jgi:phage FluMu gp28-like protein
MAICVEAALKRGTYIWGAPTFDQVRISFRETQRAAAGVANFNLSRMTVEFPNGGEIIFRSLDNPDNARGYTADGVVIDECGVVKPEAWHEVLRPMLIDTNGWAWMIGTPKGRNWFFNEFQKAQSGDHPDYAAWQVPTLGVAIRDGVLVRQPHPLENPDVPFSEIEQLFKTLSERVFEQEILAQFVDLSGGVFRRILEAATAQPQDGAIVGHDYIIGVDWGKSADFTVLTVIDTTTNEVCYLDRFNQIDYAIQTQRLTALCERFSPSNVIVERNSIGEPLIEQLYRAGLPVQPFQTTNATKATAIDALALAFERGDLRIINDAVLIAELQAYEMERLPSGLMRYNAPSGMHDDCVMSLALAYQGAVTSGPLLLWGEG